MRISRDLSVLPVSKRRKGAASLDYVLVLGVVLPILAVAMPLGFRIARSVYDFLVVTISWPFF